MNTKFSRIAFFTLTFCLIASGCSLFQKQQFKQVEKLQDLPKFPMIQDFDRKVFPAIVRIEDSNGQFVCTGTVVSDDYVLTAAHCLLNENFEMSRETYKIVTLPGYVEAVKTVRTIDAKAAAVNKRADYALIIGNFKELTKMQLIPTIVDIWNGGNPVVTCGFAYGEKLASCFSINKAGYYNFGFATDAPLYPGMSGGPVVNRAGYIIAVNSYVEGNTSVCMPLVGLFDSLSIEVVE